MRIRKSSPQGNSASTTDVPTSERPSSASNMDREERRGRNSLRQDSSRYSAEAEPNPIRLSRSNPFEVPRRRSTSLSRTTSQGRRENDNTEGERHSTTQKPGQEKRASLRRHILRRGAPED